MNDRKTEFARGMKDGLPICMGYLAVSFSFGIIALEHGLTIGQAVMMSALNLTSAGQFASLAVISAAGSYIELALSQLIINLRYCLMSCSLSQKIDPKTPFFHRFFVAFGNTDEVFALSSAQRGFVSPFYSYGVILVALAGWTGGTFLGAAAGSVLPPRVLSALGVALYGMFIAIIVPPATENKTLRTLILAAMALSALFTYAPLLREISAGIRIIILTVAVAAGAAVLAPVKEETP